MKLKPHTTPDGADHPNAVWLPDFVALEHSTKTGRVLMPAYHDVSALAAGRAPLAGTVANPAPKEYLLADDTYLQVAGSPVNVDAPGLAAKLAAAIPGAEEAAVLKVITDHLALPGCSLLGVLAQAVYDHLVPTADTKNPADPDGPLVSFFQGCPDAS